MSSIDAVEYLLLRLYPGKAVNLARAEVSEGKIRDRAEDYVYATRIYERVLRGLAPETLKALVDDERERDAAQLQERLQQREQSHFFNKPETNADYAYWTSRSCWTLDETVALILGKDPRIVDWAQIEPLVKKSEFAQRFADIRAHLERAILSGQLLGPVSPPFLLSWANNRGVVLPGELEERIAARKDQKRKPDQGRQLSSSDQWAPAL